jgi:hypothetical protein
MRHRSSTLIWVGPLALLMSIGGRRVAAAERPAPACKNAGVTVSFDRGSMEIDESGRGALAGVAAWLENNDERTVRLEGFTDRTGGATGNQRLSERRAQAVKDYLVTRGIEPDRLMVFGHGEAADRPLPAGSEGRIVLVTACEVPKEAAAAAQNPTAVVARTSNSVLKTVRSSMLLVRRMCSTASPKRSGPTAGRVHIAAER